MRQDRDRAQGRLDEAGERMKSEFDVKTLKGANALLKKLEDEEEAAGEEFDTALESFKDKWADELGT